jgi:nucleoside-diphosphate-sugar epimerase
VSILLTGGTGFLGAQVARFLVEQSQDSLVLFDISPSTKLVEDIKAAATLVRGDLGNFSHVLDVVKEHMPRVIFHLGGMLSVPSDADPPAAFRANAVGTFNVLESARLFGVSQVIFASTIAAYGLDLDEGATIDDYTLQRPELFYGATKVFGELMGRFYRRKYGIDFRGVRLPAVVGPGQRTPSVVQYTSSMISESYKGRPFVANILPETRAPVMYFKDAARAVVELAQAPIERIRTVNYLVAGAKPVATAQQLADEVRRVLPKADITFQPDMETQKILQRALHPVDDRIALQEWGWQAGYDLPKMVEDFVFEMETSPQLYV